MAKQPPGRSFLPYGRQVIDEADIAAVTDVLRSDFLTTGPVVDRFEEAFASEVDASFAVVCSNGTAALHLAALALDIGSGDHVVVPALTFLATANAPRLAGAEIIFADVDPDTGLLTGETLEDALKRAGAARVKAVFPVHLNGQCVSMTEISRIADKKEMTVVEDACHALGTRYESNGASVAVGAGAHSTLACFSFHPVKTIAMGEGGAITGNDPKLAERMRRLRNHGIERRPEYFTRPSLSQDKDASENPWYYEMPEIGLNYRASDIHCALGLSQLGRLNQFIDKRRALAVHYDAQLARLAPLVMPVARVPDCDSVLHLYAVLIDFEEAGQSRAQVMKKLKAHGIGTQVHYLPVHQQPYYCDRYGELELPGARSYYERCLSLPLFPAMESDDVDFVVETLEEVLGQ